MNLMDLIKYFPTIFALFTILISGVLGSYLKKKTEEQIGRQIGEHRIRLVTNHCLGWTVLIGAINTIPACLMSLAVIYASQQSNDINFVLFSIDKTTFFIIFLIIIIIGSPLFYVLFINQYHLHQLVSIRTNVLNFTTAQIINIILIILNVLLGISIFLNS